MEVSKLIGNTPMIKIKYKYENKIKKIYTKLEMYNLTGSIKDRVAYYIINGAKKRRELREGMSIIEATSGNTGISLAALGRIYKHPVYIFMPDWVSKERIDIIKSFGAKIFLFSKEDGGFKRCLEESKKLASSINGFLANQFSNEDNFLAHFETTGEEILKQIPKKIFAFVSGVGTGGTLMGIGKKLKMKNPGMKIICVEPDKMPIISGGEIISQHKIEGIGDDFVPELLNKDDIDKIILINDDDAINMSRIFARDLGIGIGISSGANFIGGVLSDANSNDIVVTVFPDDNKKYLSTDLSRDIDKNNDFISNKIKLLDYEVIC